MVFHAGGAIRAVKQPCVDVLASRPNGTLSVGVTSDLVRRVWEHNTDAPGGFTARHRVHLLVWFELHQETGPAWPEGIANLPWFNALPEGLPDARSAGGQQVQPPLDQFDIAAQPVRPARQAAVLAFDQAQPFLDLDDVGLHLADIATDGAEQFRHKVIAHHRGVFAVTRKEGQYRPAIGTMQPAASACRSHIGQGARRH